MGTIFQWIYDPRVAKLNGTDIFFSLRFAYWAFVITTFVLAAVFWGNDNNTFGQPYFNLYTTFYTTVPATDGQVVQQINTGDAHGYKAYVHSFLIMGGLVAAAIVTIMLYALNYFVSVHMMENSKVPGISLAELETTLNNLKFKDFITSIWNSIQERNVSFEVWLSDAWATIMIFSGIAMHVGERSWTTIFAIGFYMISYAFITLAADIAQSYNLMTPSIRMGSSHGVRVMRKLFPRFFHKRSAPIMVHTMGTVVLAGITVWIAVFYYKMPRDYKDKDILAIICYICVLVEWLKHFARGAYIAYTSRPFRTFIASLFGIGAQGYSIVTEKVEKIGEEVPDEIGDVDVKRIWMNMFTRETFVTLCSIVQITVYIYTTMGGYSYTVIPALPFAVRQHL